MPAPRPRDEFTLIERLFAPLAAAAPGALGLRDDAALIAPGPGRVLVATTDMTVAGVHFLADDPPDLIARKILRVNLSDLAAMGAKPLGYLLGLAIPDTVSVAWIESFARGLAEDQAEFVISLLGGDTTATGGPVCLSITAFGEVEEGAAILRSGAQPGDDIYVSGTIGDAALGLLCLLGPAPSLGTDHAAALIARYRLPEPQTLLGRGLVGLATAAADISDGLIADLGHICKASGVGAQIESQAVPVSQAASAARRSDADLSTTILTGGDDYELVFCAAHERAGDVAILSEKLGLALSPIGSVSEGKGVTVIGPDGTVLEFAQTGYRHFTAATGD